MTRTCKLCLSSFLSEYSYQKHLVVKHKNKSKFSCKHCSKTFYTNKELKRHMDVHEQQKFFICHACDHIFNRLSALKRHKEDIHKLKPNVCDICKQDFDFYDDPNMEDLYKQLCSNLCDFCIECFHFTY